MPKTIDGRHLFPPAPLQRTLEALDELAPGEEIRLLLNMRPHPLYRMLKRSGFAWREVRLDNGSLEIHIFHRPARTS